MTYTPPKVWKWNAESGGEFASINRPIAGATHDKELPVGEHPFQLHSLATPNGVKVTVMFEELLQDTTAFLAWLEPIHSFRPTVDRHFELEILGALLHKAYSTLCFDIFQERKQDSDDVKDTDINSAILCADRLLSPMLVGLLKRYETLLVCSDERKDSDVAQQRLNSWTH